jgi:hypothetical protein
MTIAPTQPPQSFAHPIPPDFTLETGLTITHYTEETPKGIRLRASPLDSIRLLTADEKADYTAKIVEWMNSNGYILNKITKTSEAEALV